MDTRLIPVYFALRGRRLGSTKMVLIVLFDFIIRGKVSVIRYDTCFFQYTSEPFLIQRKSIGFKAILIFFTKNNFVI